MKPTHSLSKTAFARRLVNCPEIFHDLKPQIGPSFQVKFTEPERRVKEAEHDCDGGKERTPSILSRFPAIKAYRLLISTPALILAYPLFSYL